MDIEDITPTTTIQDLRNKTKQIFRNIDMEKLHNFVLYIIESNPVSNKEFEKYSKLARRKFKILPKLIPLEEEYGIEIKEPENLDGSNRQLKGEIIQNEHDILNELLGNNEPEKLDGFDEQDAVIFKEQEETIPLPNQNFGDMKEHTNSASENQEYCASCNKPVKAEWKACPFCGEFLEIYED